MHNPFHHDPNYLAYLDSLPKQFFIDILENLFLGVYVSDKDGNTLYTNPAITKHYGKRPEELTAYTNWGIWQGIVSPPAYREAIETRRTLFYRQMHFFSKEILTTIATPVLDEHGDFKYLIGITQDNITQFDRCYNERRDRHAEGTHLSHFEGIIGEDKAYLQELLLLQRAAKSKTSILILGESGTGKSVAARYVHHYSPRRDKPFMEINCAAIPENLLESELFGYVPHAFTGASPKGKKGLFQLADGGTLFLDEIGDLPLSLQSKLLFVLETGKFLPVGSEKYVEADVRVVCATNQDLEARIAEKRFRDDLYWRVNAITATIPPLRERPDDIVPLAHYFLEKCNQEHHSNKKFDPLFLSYLLAYSWPGNIRELKNIIERCYILSPGYNISADKFPKKIKDLNPREKSPSNDPFSDGPLDFDQLVSDYEARIIRDIYTRERSIVGVQKRLSLSQNKAFRLVRKYCADLLPKNEKSGC